MDPSQSQKKSYKLIWIAGASFAVLVVVIGVTFAVVSQNQPKKAASTTAATTKTAKVATKEQVQKDIAALQANLKKAADYTAAAKAAIADTPTKVGK